MSTDEEQDLIRAMLVMAAAGLDSMVKQLIRDVLPGLVHRDPQARSMLERFIAGRFDSDEPLEGAPRGREFLAKVFSDPNPADVVVASYVAALTAGSLQSAAELAKSAAAFGFSSQDLGINFEELRPIFDTRNKIIHELDINFEAERRNRNLRNKAGQITSTNRLLEVGEEILIAVDRKVVTLEGSPT